MSSIHSDSEGDWGLGEATQVLLNYLSRLQKKDQGRGNAVKHFDTAKQVVRSFNGKPKASENRGNAQSRTACR